jgi:hypothetical protein
MSLDPVIISGTYSVAVAFPGYTRAGRGLNYQSINFIMTESAHEIVDINRHKAELQRAVARAGVAPSSREFLLKALYPPGEQTKVAIPDSTWRPSGRFDFRPSVTITKPSGQTTGTWDCLIVVPPGDVTGAIVATAQSGDDDTFTSFSPPAEYDAYQVPLVPKGLGVTERTIDLYRLENLSVPPYAVTGTHLTGNSRLNPLELEAFRSTYRGATVHMTSSKLNDGGSIVTGQYDTEYFQDHSFLTQYNRPLAGGTPSNGIALPARAEIPLSSTAVTEMCPGAQVSEARDGAYLPLRLLGPEQPFVQTKQAFGRTRTYRDGAVVSYVDHTVTAAAPTGNNSQANIGAFAEFNVAYGQSAPWWQYVAASRETADSNPTYVDDTGYDNVATGVIIVKGLSIESSLTLQLFVGLECILREQSPVRSFASAAAELDPFAMDFYYKIVNSMPFAYPASANSLGAIFPLIASKAMMVAKSLAPHVLPAVGSLLSQGAARINSAAVQRAENMRAMPPRRERPVIREQIVVRPAPRARSARRAPAVAVTTRQGGRRRRRPRSGRV